MTVQMSVEASGAIQMQTAADYSVGGTIYHGGFEFTPSTEEQTVSTANKVLAQDIVIHAIPSNYGRIDWDGSIISIS